MIDDADKPLLTLDEFNRRIVLAPAQMAAEHFVAMVNNPLWRELMSRVPPQTRWQRLTAPFRRFWWRCQRSWEAFRDV